MEYYVFATEKRIEGRLLEKESRRRRTAPNPDFWLELVSKSQLGKHEWEYWTKSDAFYTFQCDVKNQDPAYLFECYLLREHGIVSFKEFELEQENVRVENLTDDVLRYIAFRSDIETFTVRKMKKDNLIYHLMDGDEIVYVGQSKSGIKRPFEHTDKKWDSVKYHIIPDHLNLNVVEKIHIDKHKPKYNKGTPVSDKVMKKVYSSIRALVQPEAPLNQ